MVKEMGIGESKKEGEVEGRGKSRRDERLVVENEEG
jgi:hypothetical protein